MIATKKRRGRGLGGRISGEPRRMQMHDTRRHAPGGAVVAVLAEAFEGAPAEADAALRTILPELAWHLERNTLSRGGLADLVEAVGSGHHARSLGDANAVRGEAVAADGNAILGHVLG